MILLLTLGTSLLPIIREGVQAAGFSVSADGLEVFWDENCTEKVNFIEWGTLLPGSTRNVRLYVWNAMNESVFLYMETENWVPLNAEDHIKVRLHHDPRSIKPEEAFAITLPLQVSSHVHNITAFSFDTVFNGLSHPPTDLNKDKKVDMRDIAITAKAYGSYPGHPSWNPVADLNKDGKICMLDLTLVVKDYGLQ